MRRRVRVTSRSGGGSVPGAHTSARAALARRRRPRRGRAWVGEGARDVGCARGSRLRRHPRARPPRWFKLAPSRLGVWHPLLAGRAEPERVDGRGRGRRVGRGGADERRGRRGRVRGRMGRGRRRRRRRRRRLGRGRHRRPRRLPRGRGMGRRLGRRCPRGHRRLGLRPRGRTAGRVRMGRVRPARRSRREPHRVRRGPERSLGQGKSHPPNRRRATRSLIVSARVGAPLGSEAE